MPLSPYVVGNPATPTIPLYGFQDFIRDFGRVTDGVIKGNACECENFHPTYHNA